MGVRICTAYNKTMGYQVLSGNEMESLSEDVWFQGVCLASKYDFSAPRLMHLGRRDMANLTDEEAAGLIDALERALSAGEPREHISSDEETLNRDTVRRVATVLRQPGTRVVRHAPSFP